MESLIFATNNQHKVAEVKSILTGNIKILSLAEAGIKIDIPEPYDTLEQNACEKARVINITTGQDCFAEDTGLQVEALDGEPGVRSARYAGEKKSSEENIKKLLKNLQNKENKAAQFKTVICVIIDGKQQIFDGICAGAIIEEERGESGFGYDAIFIPEGAQKTFAEMTMEEKNVFSHRKKAFVKLTEFLNNSPSDAQEPIATQLENLNLKSNQIPSQNDLIQGCIDGDRQMQQLLYTQFASKMYGVCLRYAGNENDANDIMQEGFIKVFKSLAKFRSEGSFEGWVRRIFINTAIEQFRKKVKLHRVTEVQENTIEDTQLNALDSMAAKDIVKIVNELSPGYKAVFNMHVIEGYSHKEIAGILGITEGTSKSQLARAKSVLKKLVPSRLDKYKQ